MDSDIKNAIFHVGTDAFDITLIVEPDGATELAKPALLTFKFLSTFVELRELYFTQDTYIVSLHI